MEGEMEMDMEIETEMESYVVFPNEFDAVWEPKNGNVLLHFKHFLHILLFKYCNYKVFEKAQKLYSFIFSISFNLFCTKMTIFAFLKIQWQEPKLLRHRVSNCFVFRKKFWRKWKVLWTFLWTKYQNKLTSNSFFDHHITRNFSEEWQWPQKKRKRY
jgi:hypothetical protein